MSRPVIVLADLLSLQCDFLRTQFAECGCDVVELSTCFEAPLRVNEVSAIVLGANRSSDDLARALSRLREYAAAPIIVLANKGSEELAVSALRHGATDYFNEHCQLLRFVETVLVLVRRRESEWLDLKNHKSIVGSSPSMLDIKRYIQRIASSDSNVLVTGETGTGKELIAELIHINSKRGSQRFVCLNCAAVPDNLFESELFGYERGAFTGATAANAGKLEQADQGTIFLDEIGEMSLAAQAKVLRVIERKPIQRLGGHKNILLNVRIIAATNLDLDLMTERNTFRKDLYFRLNVARIHLPPLRDRKSDIPDLLAHCISELNETFGLSVRGMEDEALQCFLNYSWPGNVRELRNVLESVFLTCPGHVIRFADFPDWFRRKCSPEATVTEQDRILLALSSTRWNVSAAAGKLRWSRMTMYRKIAKYQLRKPMETKIMRDDPLEPPLVENLVGNKVPEIQPPLLLKTPEGYHTPQRQRVPLR